MRYSEIQIERLYEYDLHPQCSDAVRERFLEENVRVKWVKRAMRVEPSEAGIPFRVSLRELLKTGQLEAICQLAANSGK